MATFGFFSCRFRVPKAVAPSPYRLAPLALHPTQAPHPRLKRIPPHHRLHNEHQRHLHSALCNLPPLPQPSNQLPAPAPLLLTPTLHPTGFLKNPSLVANSPSLNTNPYRRNTVATISASSISATFRPTQLLGP